MPTDVETQQWARTTRASWELRPLVEMHEGQRVQVGFELELYARLPDLSSEEESPMEALWQRLCGIAESLPAVLAPGARIEVEPFEAADRLRPETGFAPEVMLQARLFHASDYFAPVGEADRQQVKPLEQRLSALGLRQRSW
ncbi:MAG TPA: hypothetical protein VMX54_11375 [Vicinamibacteria bacterium]|nr:hypothetical protein [Vicinamibacteria bacterium]